MSVMTPARTTHTPRSVDYVALTPQERDHVTRTLRDLGIDDAGYTIDHGVPNPAHRAAISATAAQQIGLHLPAGHELALCHDCLTIGDANDMRESSDEAWRCTDSTDPFNADCYTAWAIAYDIRD